MHIVTTIKTSCPVCGDVELKPAQMRLVVCSRSDWSYYAFACTACRDEIRKPADEEIVARFVRQRRGKREGYDRTPFRVEPEQLSGGAWRDL
jgi:hypothetical protein